MFDALKSTLQSPPVLATPAKDEPLTPTPVLHISIFVHLCEAFLGIYPHFDLFKSLFFLNPYPNFSNVATVGGANLELRSEMVGKYIMYTPCR